MPTRGRWLLEQPGLCSTVRRTALHTSYDNAINECFVKYWSSRVYTATLKVQTTSNCTLEYSKRHFLLVIGKKYSLAFDVGE